MRLRVLLLFFVLLATCGEREGESSATPREPRAQARGEPRGFADERADEREAMVRTQLAGRDVRDEAVLAAMRRVPRHRFVPAAYQAEAYADYPLRIGHDQTISQPYIVGLMTQMAQVRRGQRVLEIGTGSGYQAAVLAELGADVYSIEIVRALGESARARLRELEYGTVQVRIGDGYQGWPEQAPFDAILLTAAPPAIPEPLLGQLAVGGRLVAPIGRDDQELVVVTRTQDGYERSDGIPVRFVPMTGRAQRDPTPR